MKLKWCFKDIHQSCEIQHISVPEEREVGMDAILVDISSGGETKELTLFGGKGYVENKMIFQMNGLNVTASFGSRIIPVPFSIRLRDFQLDRYPGTNNPSSFASEVTLIDERVNLEEDRRIFYE